MSELLYTQMKHELLLFEYEYRQIFIAHYQIEFSVSIITMNLNFITFQMMQVPFA